MTGAPGELDGRVALITGAARLMMPARSGSIVNVASIAGINGGAGLRSAGNAVA